MKFKAGNFTAIRRKLKTLMRHHRLHLLYPIALEKWIVQVDPSGEQLRSRRKSPARGQLTDLFAELVRLPELVGMPNFSIECLLIRVEEVRCPDVREADAANVSVFKIVNFLKW